MPESSNYETSHPKTAERLMLKKILSVSGSFKIKDVKKYLESGVVSEVESFNYIYVVDSGKRLIGVLSLKDIFHLNDDTLVADSMHKDIISARKNTDQEHLVSLALRHSLKSVPVVDKEGVLLGVVPPHTILKILHEEGVEDMLLSAGIIHGREFGKYDLSNLSIFKNVLRRVPWLIVGLIGGVFAAYIIRSFEESLEQELLIAAFIPAVVYIADSVGTQTQTIFVRLLAIDKRLQVLSYSMKEMGIAVFMAIILSLILGAITLLIWGDQIMAIILVISIFFTILVSVAIALILPLISLRIKADPAIASGPFATTVRDLLSLLIYFAVANYMLMRF